MRRVFLVLAGIVMAASGLMIFLAGVGAFDVAPRVESFEPHRLLGRGLFLVSLLAVGAAALARLPGRVIGLTALVTGLVLLQSVIAVVARGFEDGDATTVANVVFGLHAVNGLIALGVARSVFLRARELAGKARSGSQGAPAAPASAS